MWSARVDARWQQLAEEVFVGIAEWRLTHPRATLTELEDALDSRWASARARILQDVALASSATDLTAADPAGRRRCPECAEPLEARGQEARHLTTTFDQPITLTRSRAVCPACGRGLFPPR